MPRHFLNFRRSPITKINFRVGSLGNIKNSPDNAGLFLRLFSLNQKTDNKQRDDINDFYHRINRRAGRVFVRIADRVSGNRGLMGETSLSAVISFFNTKIGAKTGSNAGTII
ncbi:MAG: hypothetical protein UX27_C0029G0002 [Candidatus Azambacteria bacterium GW2011_GWA2_45_90]|uniref:Uncharacterized protein n=1 Tax=Candidatus Azambacteria bacterium GW2011_GWA2_45_90 TaxID=1618614 RepID=A0A0G1R9Q3_9BACT|nr:MAG: hypothetical protein UX27_C0029G0002 [Candidatus Azambacteria bacterium GW2011_GWA2_45_90]